MPAAIPLIVSIVGAATGAATLGANLYAQANQPSSAAPQTSATDAINAEQQRRDAIVRQAQLQLPGLQSQTSGSVSPGYYQDMSSVLSGNADMANSPQLAQAVQQFLGGGSLGSGGSNGATSGVNNSSIIPSIFPGIAQPTPEISSATSNWLSPQPAGQSANPFS